VTLKYIASKDDAADLCINLSTKMAHSVVHGKMPVKGSGESFAINKIKDAVLIASTWL